MIENARTWIFWKVKQDVFYSCVIEEAIFDGSLFEKIKYIPNSSSNITPVIGDSICKKLLLQTTVETVIIE